MALCFNPIQIYNQSRFIDTSNRHPILMSVRCGHCSNCQEAKAAEWYFRAYKHFEDCVNRGGFVLFDCLTYAPKHLPHLSDYPEFSCLPKHFDFPCFSRRDLRLFHVRLRKSLRKIGYGSDAYSYFIGCEYGADDRYTHRPHYHVLFYVYCDIDPLKFSLLVAKCWSYGRTDGIPYKSRLYVENNVFRSISVGGRRVSRYVSKYVQKSSEFEKQIKKRIDYVLHTYFSLDDIFSDDAKEMKRVLHRVASQFHLQSKSFGLSALHDVDVDSLIQRGFFVMPSFSKNAVTRVPISNYYLRKLFYEKITLPDGYQCWSLNDSGLRYMEIRSQNMLSCLSNQYKAFSFRCKVNVDCDELAKYSLFYKGRLMANDLRFSKVQDVFDRAKLFVYSSNADKNHFSKRFLSTVYLGYRDNYKMSDCDLIDLFTFVNTYVINQNTIDKFKGFDDILAKFVFSSDYKEKVFGYYQLHERLSNIHKSLQ